MAVLLKELENPNTNVSARRGLVLGVGTLAHSYRNTREVNQRTSMFCLIKLNTTWLWLSNGCVDTVPKFDAAMCGGAILGAEQ